ncbi:hypothetical protein [Cognaticolwellia beringensis]|nr:hypothetical protein [Cognaticolwellia beringensis]
MKKSPYKSLQCIDIFEFSALGDLVGDKTLADALIESQEFAEMQMRI